MGVRVFIRCRCGVPVDDVVALVAVRCFRFSSRCFLQLLAELRYLPLDLLGREPVFCCFGLGDEKRGEFVDVDVALLAKRSRCLLKTRLLRLLRIQNVPLFLKLVFELGYFDLYLAEAIVL